MLTIEAGKFYVTRGKGIVGPMRRAAPRDGYGPEWVWVAEKCGSWGEMRAWREAGSHDPASVYALDDWDIEREAEGSAPGADDPVEAPLAPDLVNHPPHYTTGGIECIDAMKAMLTPEEFIGYLRGNSFKYRWRFRHKGGAEDLRKASWYEEKLLEIVGQ